MTPTASEWSTEPQTNVTGLSDLAGEKSSVLELAERLGQLGHWQISLPDYAITWSTEVYRLHGVTPDRYQPTLETAMNFYHPNNREVVQAAITGAARDGVPEWDESQSRLWRWTCGHALLSLPVMTCAAVLTFDLVGDANNRSKCGEGLQAA